MGRKSELGQAVLSDFGRAIVVFFLAGMFAESMLADILVISMFYYVLRGVFRSFLLAVSMLTDEGESPLDSFIPSVEGQNDIEGLAKALMREGEYEEALDFLDKALEADPTDARRYLLRGLVLRHLAEDGGSDELVRSAIRDLQSAMVLSRTIAAIPQTDLLVGRLFTRLGEKEKARRHLQRVLAHNDAPDHVLEEAKRMTASLS